MKINSRAILVALFLLAANISFSQNSAVLAGTGAAGSQDLNSVLSISNDANGNVILNTGGIAGGVASLDASAIAQFDATDKGLLIPRMTQAQRDAIGSPATGLLIYQTDNTAGYYSYDGASWGVIGGTGGASQLTDLSDVNTATVTAGNVLVGDGTDFESVAISGDATITSAGVLTIGTGAVETNEILDNTITTTDLAATQTFVDGDYINLSSIIHDDAANQGLRLPQIGASPTNLGAGEGFIGWDETNNELEVFDGSTWTTVGGGGSTTPADDVFRIQDNGDATKQLAFEASGITTATTRTITVPDLDGEAVLKDATANREHVVPSFDANGLLTFNNANNNIYYNGAEQEFTINSAPTTNFGYSLSVGPGSVNTNRIANIGGIEFVANQNPTSTGIGFRLDAASSQWGFRGSNSITPVVATNDAVFKFSSGTASGTQGTIFNNPSVDVSLLEMSFGNWSDTDGSTSTQQNLLNIQYGIAHNAASNSTNVGIYYDVTEGQKGSGGHYSWLQTSGAMRLSNYAGGTVPSEAGAATHAMGLDANGVLLPIALSSGSAGTDRVLTADATAISADNNATIFLNGSGSSVAYTLLAAPSDGDQVRVSAVDITNTCSINGAGKNINGAGSFTFGTQYEAVTLKFNTTLDSWFIVSKN